VGQVYNGQPSKAVVFFFVFVAAIYGTAEIDPLPFALLIPFTFLFNIVDAYRSADAINMRHAGGEPLKDEDGIESPVWGGALVVLGLVLLLNNLGLIPIEALRRLWPVALIVVGGVLLWGSFRRRDESGDASPGPSATSSTGGAASGDASEA
jgi:purine-cytosine permease-like protein